MNRFGYDARQEVIDCGVGVTDSGNHLGQDREQL